MAGWAPWSPNGCHQQNSSHVSTNQQKESTGLLRCCGFLEYVHLKLQPDGKPPLSSDWKWADPNSQSNGIFCTMWHHAQCWSGELAKREAFSCLGASWALGGENTVCCICFYQYYWLLFSSPFARRVSVKLFSSQPASFYLLSFGLSSPSHVGGGKEWKSNSVVLLWKLRQNHNTRRRALFFMLVVTGLHIEGLGGNGWMEKKEWGRKTFVGHQDLHLSEVSRGNKQWR